jgi:hypothetical protein
MPLAEPGMAVQLIYETSNTPQRWGEVTHLWGVLIPFMEDRYAQNPLRQILSL